MAGHLRGSGSEGHGTLFETTREPFSGADAHPEVVCGSGARGAGRRADPGCRDVLPQRGKRRGRPVSPGSRRLRAWRTGNRNTERKGNQPSLTCKQGFHLEEPAQTEPRNIRLHPDPPATNPLAHLRAHQAGTGAGGGGGFRPHRLQPRVRGKPAADGYPAPGQGALLAGGSDRPEKSAPSLIRARDPPRPHPRDSNHRLPQSGGSAEGGGRAPLWG